MDAILAWIANTKIGRFFIGLFAVLLAALGLGLVAYEKGKKQQASADDAKDAQSLADAAEQVVKASNDRTEVENENAKLPDAPAQKVADAAPDTAAGELRDDGWTH